jgi:hypothetical protein
VPERSSKLAFNNNSDRVFFRRFILVSPACSTQRSRHDVIQ